MTRQEKLCQSQEKVRIKPIRKIIHQQNMFVDLNAFQDDMDEHAIEYEWGMSSGTTILTESSIKYDILEKINNANRELCQEKQRIACLEGDTTADGSSSQETEPKTRSVHFPGTLHTTHYVTPEYGDSDDGSYWSGCSPRELFDEEEGEEVVCDMERFGNGGGLVSWRGLEKRACAEDFSRRTDHENQSDYEQESDDSSSCSSADLSALTDSVDRLDLSPLDTDTPDIFKPAAACGQQRQTQPHSTNYELIECEDNRLVAKTGSKDTKGDSEGSKWTRACCEVIRNNCVAKTRRICLTQQDQSKLPKYNGLRSQYGLSEHQLLERKRVKSVRRKQREERRLQKIEEADKKRRTNELVYNSWLHSKKQQLQDKNRRMSAKNSSQQSAQTVKKRSMLQSGSKLCLIRRIMSASGSAKEQRTYNIYLGIRPNSSSCLQSSCKSI